MLDANGPRAPSNGGNAAGGPLGGAQRPLVGRGPPFGLPGAGSASRAPYRDAMDTSSDTAPPVTATGPAAADRPRWPYAGHGQQTLLWASILITVGAFLPWLMTSFGTFGGMRGAGSWTVFAGVIGIGASLMRSRRAVYVHALGIAALAISLPLWQVVHLVGTVGFTGWLPGIGLIMTLAGGVAIARATLELRAGD
jgi:hypothetical protein